MIYLMHLAESPFALIKSGQKTVEMRLANKGRDKIKPNDHIVFHNEKMEEKLEVLVVNINRFPSFHELYKAYDKIKLGYLENEIANPDDMQIYYSKEDIQKYGVLAIEIKLL